jgi:hypothetical protein
MLRDCTAAARSSLSRLRTAPAIFALTACGTITVRSATPSTLRGRSPFRRSFYWRTWGCSSSIRSLTFRLARKVAARLSAHLEPGLVGAPQA